MRSVNFLVAAAAVSILPTLAFSADMPIMPPPSYGPPPVQDFGGWYLRGDIGFSNQNTKNVRDTNSAAYNNIAVAETKSFSSAGIYGGGIGYQFNNWFRADITGQYRGKSNFSGLDVVTGTGPFVGFVGTDAYTATKSELLFLANGYIDLGTWWCMTPFVGAGVGTARVSIGNFTDTGDFLNPGQVHSLNYAGEGNKWNFAWAAHAGVAYRVNQSLTLELAYSYVDLGSGITGASHSFDQVTNTTHAPFSFNNITSNDVKLGLRWNFDNYAPPPPPPLIRKG
jgi:opacity protein-like surface antigen